MPHSRSFEGRRRTFIKQVQVRERRDRVIEQLVIVEKTPASVSFDDVTREGHQHDPQT